MMRYMCLCVMVACVLATVGCSQVNQVEKDKQNLVSDGWLPAGKVKVQQDSGQDVIRAVQLPGVYSKVCLQSDGKATINRFAIVFDNGSTFLSPKGLTFDGPGTQVIELPKGSPRIDHIALSYTDGRYMYPTTVFVWVK